MYLIFLFSLLFLRLSGTELCLQQNHTGWNLVLVWASLVHLSNRSPVLLCMYTFIVDTGFNLATLEVNC